MSAKKKTPKAPPKAAAAPDTAANALECATRIYEALPPAKRRELLGEANELLVWLERKAREETSRELLDGRAIARLREWIAGDEKTRSVVIALSPKASAATIAADGRGLATKVEEAVDERALERATEAVLATWKGCAS